MMSEPSLPLIGWREWLDLPDLGITGIKAKIDTGARSSALHAIGIEAFETDRPCTVRFQVHPDRSDLHRTILAEAELLEWREVKNSGGQKQLRPAIRTTIAIGGSRWPIELTLTSRDLMGFPMLLGREALRKRFFVDPGRSFLFGQGNSPSIY
jgi:hypothetical protein